MIKKAIIPVAGFGTRFLPASKAQPKQMLPVVDKPVIQYIVEEAVLSGIEEIIFITSQNTHALEDYFDSNFELEYLLEQKNKMDILEEIRKISMLAKFAYVRQKSPKGDGDAIRQAAHLVGDEPCAVLFGDDIVQSETPCLKQLMNVFEKFKDVVVAVKRVPEESVSQYGVIGGIQIEDRLYQVHTLIEKPKKEEAPSNLAIIGKYIITPDVFEILLDPKTKYFSGEVRLADAFSELLKKKPLYAFEFEGRRYDCGSKLGLLEANVEFGLLHKELGNDFQKFLESINHAHKKNHRVSSPSSASSGRV